MTRKMISLAGVAIALLSFTVGGSDVEARHGRGRRNCCCQQFGNNGYQQHANYGSGYSQGNSGGYGYGYGNSGSYGNQHTSNYGSGQAAYGTSGTSINAGGASVNAGGTNVNAGQTSATVEATAPVPNN